MAATLSAKLESKLTVTETFTGAYIDTNDATVTTSLLNETITLTGSTTPAVTKETSFQQALTAGAATIDLTALPGKTADETVNGTGLKVQQIKLRNLSSNANTITIVKGASNGYALLGAAMNITLAPGQSVLVNLNGAAPIIGSGAKTLDLSGTGAQILEVQLTMG